jgi:PAS domain S-box-containing protein
MATKTKILIPMFLLTAILIFIGSVITYTNYEKIVSLQKLNAKIVLSSNVSALLHAIQNERGLSCAFTVNEKNNFKKELSQQRTLTDSEIKKLKNDLHRLSCPSFKRKTERLLTRVSYLKEIREEINKHHISYDGIIKYYSNINTTLLDILVNISKKSHVPLITENILAYINLLYLKEYMGRERAEGVTIFSKKELTREFLIRFSNILSLEKRSESMFLKYASEDMATVYNNKIKKNSFIKTKNMRNIILYKELLNTSVDPREWFQTLTKNLKTLDQVSNYIEKETLKNIQREIRDLRNTFIFLSLLIILSLFIFILMLVAFFKLAREEQRLRVVMDKYIISSTTDLKGKIIDVSEAFCTISGYTKKELIGKPHSIVRHPDMPKETFKTMWFRLERGLSWSGKVKNKRKDGSFYWVYANVEPLFNSGGNIDSYISIRLDITESELLILKVKDEEKKSKFQEDMIREQSRLAQMGEMISMIAHQWRQPLSAIAAASGSIQLKAKRDKLTSETAIELAEKIKNFSKHLSVTIDDFRNFFKTNKQTIETDFSKILNNVLSIIEGSLQRNGIDLQIELNDPIIFFTYENEIKQVILNLIKNAEDALVDNKIENPYIHIFINNTTFIIKDNAGGIAEDIIGKIFDPYFSTKTKKDGTGLGLYMSKMIIEDHCKGKIQVSNEKDGAKFQITLGDKND